MVFGVVDVCLFVCFIWCVWCRCYIGCNKYLGEVIMFNSVSCICGIVIYVFDGDIGKVSEVYFDDEKWVICYLVVDIGFWLVECKVLILLYLVWYFVEMGELLYVSFICE